MSIHDVPCIFQHPSVLLVQPAIFFNVVRVYLHQGSTFGANALKVQGQLLGTWLIQNLFQFWTRFDHIEIFTKITKSLYLIKPANRSWTFNLQSNNTKHTEHTYHPKCCSGLEKGRSYLASLDALVYAEKTVPCHRTPQEKGWKQESILYSSLRVLESGDENVSFSFSTPREPWGTTYAKWCKMIQMILTYFDREAKAPLTRTIAWTGDTGLPTRTSWQIRGQVPSNRIKKLLHLSSLTRPGFAHGHVRWPALLAL